MKLTQRANPGPLVIPIVSVVAIGIILLLVTSIACCRIAYYRKREAEKNGESDVPATTSLDNQLSLQYNACYSQGDHKWSKGIQM